MNPLKIISRRLITILLVLTAFPEVRSSTILDPWVPIFKGVDHAVGTNTPGGGGFPDLQVVHAIRIDLADPDIQLLTTPQITNYAANSRETGGLTVSDFLTENGLQVAINANNFHDPGTTDSPSYNLAPGTPLEVAGLSISRGQIVSAQESSVDAASMMFMTNNQPTVVFTNWPAHSTAGVFTAVSGFYPVLVNGVNVGSNYFGSSITDHQLQPRTAYGLSPDRRYLYLLTIDGRQAGYSDGAYDYETAAWLLMIGASDGVNMDGGGSTTLVMQDSTGVPVELNQSSAVAANGYERTVGSHLGVFAKPLPGFINDIAALPDDTAATITWTTVAPSTTQVQYDVTTDFNNSSALGSIPVTNHAVLLAGLTPNTGYYYRVISGVGTTQYTSANRFFITTNYVISNPLFDVTHSWKYSTADLDGVPWTGPAYDDSSWSGPGPGLLWARATPDPTVAPKNTQMPLDPNNPSYPFVTYYFRTHFTMANTFSGSALLFSSYVDDGAVFYLNGVEINRVRMDPAPAVILNSTLALGFPCNGNATCPDEFSVSGDLITNLVAGDNVLAVEVHNYNTLSSDITFGTSLVQTRPYVSSPQLGIAYTNGTIALTWSRGGFTLQQSETSAGIWTDVPGPVISSPFIDTNSAAARYYRLRR